MAAGHTKSPAAKQEQLLPNVEAAALAALLEQFYSNPENEAAYQKWLAEKKKKKESAA